MPPLGDPVALCNPENRFWRQTRHLFAEGCRPNLPQRRPPAARRFALSLTSRTAQTRLPHQRQYLASEKIQVGKVIEKIHLYSVATRSQKFCEPFDDVLGRPDQMNVPSYDPLSPAVTTPG